MQPDDPLLVEKIIHERKAISSRFNSGVGVATSSNQTPFSSGYGQNKRVGTSKRIRSTSTSSGGLGGDYLPLPFTKLESLKLDLNTPTHLPVVEFIMSFTQVGSQEVSLQSCKHLDFLFRNDGIYYIEVLFCAKDLDFGLKN